MWRLSIIRLGLFSFLLWGCTTSPVAVDVDAHTWDINGIRIHHFEKGSGEPILVIHGGPGIPYSEPIPGMAPLTDQNTFVYYHQRGSGKSSRPIKRFETGQKGKQIWELMSVLGYKNHLQDIEAIRNRLGIDSVILMGHSFGALLGCLYAQNYPERIKALILIAPAGLITSNPGVDMFQVMEHKLPESELPGFRAFKESYLDFDTILTKSENQLRELNLAFGEFWLKAQGPEAQVTYADLPGDTALAGGFMPYGIYFSFGREWDFTPRLSKISAPVLIIHGENDLQPLEVSELYLRHLPNAELTVIPGASHFPFTETPDAFNQAVKLFLESIP